MNSIITSIRQFNLEAWWSYKTLFSSVPPQTWKFEYAYLALIIICFIVGVAIALPRVPLHTALRRRISNLVWTNVIIGIFLYFAREQRILYLGTDGLRTIQEIALIFWINAIVLYYRKGFRKELIAAEASKRFSKYLPQKK